VKFWDSSALVPLCVDEPRTTAVKAFLARDPEVVIWWGSRVECASALARLLREGKVEAGDGASAKRSLADLLAIAHEVAPTEPVRERAERLVSTHPLRAADAFQLAAALVWAEERPRGRELVSFDGRLRGAASAEGFLVLPSAGA